MGKVLVLVSIVLLAIGLSGGAVTPEEDIRDLLVTANHILAMEGLVGPFGHVSVRSGEDSFWVADHRSPDSVSLSHLREVKVDISVDEARRDHLYREIFIHSGMYLSYPEVGAVVHVHSPATVTLGTLDAGSERLRPTTNPGANLGAFFPLYETVGLVSDPEKGAALAASLQGQNGVLMRGHGAVTVGAGLKQAVLRALYLEMEAVSQLRARAAGSPHFLNEEEVEFFRHTRAVDHAWQYYVDKLERQAP